MCFGGYFRQRDRCSIHKDACRFQSAYGRGDREVVGDGDNDVNDTVIDDEDHSVNNDVDNIVADNVIIMLTMI